MHELLASDITDDGGTRATKHYNEWMSDLVLRHQYSIDAMYVCSGMFNSFWEYHARHCCNRHNAARCDFADKCTVERHDERSQEKAACRTRLITSEVHS
jgi:hypothetical protein